MSFASGLRQAQGTMNMRTMLTILVNVHVKPECAKGFVEATLDNARESRLEPGIERFELLRQSDDPARFVLVEVYRDAEAPARHKETAHYNRWRQIAEPMMAEPRTRAIYESAA